MLKFLIFFFIALFRANVFGIKCLVCPKKINLLILIKTILDKDRNVGTKIVATTHEKSGATAEVSGEKIGPIEGYF